jgi:hypothetical protein
LRIGRGSIEEEEEGSMQLLTFPPASLLESRPTLEERQHNKELLLISDGKHNNLQHIVIDVDDDGGKENVCPPSIKKNTVPLSPGQICSTCSLQQ